MLDPHEFHYQSEHYRKEAEGALARLGFRSTGRWAMRLIIGVLTVIFWVAATIFVAMVAISGFDFGLLEKPLGNRGLRIVYGASISVMLVSSGSVAWYEFRANPLEDASAFADWTWKMTLYATIFGITLFLSFFYIPSMLFAL